MKKTYFVSVAALAGLAALASSQSLLNNSFESNTNAKLTSAADEWGNSFAPAQGERGTQGIGNAGGWADHAGFAPPDGGYVGAMGDNFAYYSSRAGDEFMGQWLTDRFELGLVYTFKSWATNDGGASLQVAYEIGYLDVDGDRDSYVPVAKEVYTTTNGWLPYDGVTVMAEGDMVGKQIVVGFASDLTAGTSGGGTWVDVAELEVVPEPATMVALGAGLVALAARRRKKA